MYKITDNESSPSPCVAGLSNAIIRETGGSEVIRDSISWPDSGEQMCREIGAHLFSKCLGNHGNNLLQ